MPELGKLKPLIIYDCELISGCEELPPRSTGEPLSRRSLITDPLDASSCLFPWGRFSTAIGLGLTLTFWIHISFQPAKS